MVGHNSSNRVLLLQALDLPMSAFWPIAQDICAINEFVVHDDNRLTVLRANETAHFAAIP